MMWSPIQYLHFNEPCALSSLGSIYHAISRQSSGGGGRALAQPQQQCTQGGWRLALTVLLRGNWGEWVEICLTLANYLSYPVTATAAPQSCSVLWIRPVLWNRPVHSFGTLKTPMSLWNPRTTKLNWTNAGIHCSGRTGRVGVQG